MSACISREGEYSDHVLDGTGFVCIRCGTFDEPGCLAELERLNRVIAAYEEDADVALVEKAEAVEAESQAADLVIAEKDAEIERLRVELDTTIARADDMHESMVRQRDEAAAAHGARIAAAIRAAGHPDGYHRVDTTREWAGIYCADCAVTERSARIAETAPEGPTDA